MAHYSIQYLEERYREALSNEHLNNLYERLKIESSFFNRVPAEAGDIGGKALRDFQHIYLEILDEQRRLLTKMNSRFEFDEELIRKYLSLVDLEEFKVREKQLQRP